MVTISWPWYNGSYTITARPIKSLELHYTMIQFLIMYNNQGRKQQREKNEIPQSFEYIDLIAKSTTDKILDAKIVNN